MGLTPFAGNKTSLAGFASPVATGSYLATTPIGTAHLVYQITDEAKRIISPAASISVKVDGVVAAPDTYTLDLLFGKVTFKTAQSSDAVTCSYSYIPFTEILEGYRSVEIGGTADLVEVTTFGETAKQKYPTKLDCTVKLGRIGQGADKPLSSGDSYFERMMAQTTSGASPVLLQVAFDSEGDVLFRGFFLIKSLTDKASPDQIISEELSFESTGWPGLTGGLTTAPFGFSF